MGILDPNGIFRMQIRDEVEKDFVYKMSALRADNERKAAEIVRLRGLHKDCERIAAYIEQNFNSRYDLSIAVNHLLKVAKALQSKSADANESEKRNGS